MDASRLLTIPARYLDEISHTLDPQTELAPLRPYLRGRIAEIYCRTGRLGAYMLRAGYDWRGYDPDRDMIERSIMRVGFSVEQSIVPPPKTADTIFGLFAPLSCVTPKDLGSFALGLDKALNVGGTILLELWYTPMQARSHYALMDTYDSPFLKLVRSAVPTIDGAKAHFSFHWMVGRRDQKIHREHYEITRYLHTKESLKKAFAVFSMEELQLGNNHFLMLHKL